MDHSRHVPVLFYQTVRFYTLRNRAREAVPGMTISGDTLREVQLLLREALAKLGPDGAFRQTVLLQMALCEVERDLGPQGSDEADASDGRAEPGE
ncbi:hypothetical protein [Methylobacterium sp. Leaf118]|uniref:hypothetical protein n=1 Tax=Methylobacterium sp. Leaf118 TaxID=2876562 RepID=UPI001E56DE59|nr:hypothetical protein [Methylobacterium sp. Leaf118]